MYFIKIAVFNFRCPISGLKVKVGEVYIENERGDMFSITLLPARKLIPIKEYRNGQKVAIKSH
jgi:hypothetical protein